MDHQGNAVRPPRTADQVVRAVGAPRACRQSNSRRWSTKRRWSIGGGSRLAALACALLLLGSCAPIVRYTSELVDDRHGRTWFTRLPSTVGGTLGFAVGVPIDVVSLPVTFVVYRSQPKETRDPLSVFLFPSFVLWKVGTLVGAPFDAVEWTAYRSWQEPAPITPEEREAIERKWDALEFTEYPVTPIYPK